MKVVRALKASLHRAVATGVREVSVLAIVRATSASALRVESSVSAASGIPQAVFLGVQTVIQSAFEPEGIPFGAKLPEYAEEI
jgi:hypothetical protein